MSQQAHVRPAQVSRFRNIAALGLALVIALLLYREGLAVVPIAIATLALLTVFWITEMRSRLGRLAWSVWFGLLVAWFILGFRMAQMTNTPLFESSVHAALVIGVLSCHLLAAAYLWNGKTSRWLNASVLID